ncbi:MAG TPA: hypothetical protein VFM93_03930 [Candidatus Limnocylindria bacterium]|nr:hypothetical protein [Candidatus Limnocylindria bacterium]
MSVLVGANGPGVNWVVYPGAPVRWLYWWGPGHTLAVGAWLAAAYPPSIATTSSPVNILANSMWPTMHEGVYSILYGVDLQAEGPQAAVFRLLLGKLA